MSGWESGGFCARILFIALVTVVSGTPLAGCPDQSDFRIVDISRHRQRSESGGKIRQTSPEWGCAGGEQSKGKNNRNREESAHAVHYLVLWASVMARDVRKRILYPCLAIEVTTSHTPT